jgi:hypothetical protein
VVSETSRCTLTKWAEKPPDPASKTTAGLPRPTQLMCKLWPPRRPSYRAEDRLARQAQ